MERLSRTIDQEVLRKDWIPISIGKNGLNISDLFFADDLTLFGRSNKKKCDAILATLEGFNDSSDQKVNFQKSKVIFSANCNKDWANQYSPRLGVKKNNKFGKYLRFPIFHRRPTNRDF